MLHPPIEPLAHVHPESAWAERFLHGLVRAGQKYTPDQMSRLLGHLDHPERAVQWVQVAGTNGKGSTSCALARALGVRGRPVGLFTSPHLVNPRERIRLGDDPISPSLLTRLVPRLQQAVEKMEQSGAPPSFFEAMFALACLAFADQGLELAVAEVGVGGARDATSILDPRVLVLTSVALDHEKILGETTAAIAATKCSLARPGVPFVSAVTDPDVEAVVAREVARYGGTYAPLPPWRVEVEAVDRSGTRFRWTDREGIVRPVTTDLIGRHQARNVALALEATTWLPPDLRPDPGPAIHAVARIPWPARFQIVGDHPITIWDGGHNPQGATSCADTLGDVFPEARPVLLVGLSADKDAARMLAPLAARAGHVVFTTSPHPKAVPAAQLRSLWPGLGSVPSEAVADPVAAFVRARDLAGPSGVVLVVGSLYLIGVLIRACHGRGWPAPMQDALDLHHL